MNPICRDELQRQRDLRRWRRRRRHVPPCGRRISERERASLGLQAHVGVDDHDLERARFYRALEQAIARELREAELRPLARIGFDGRPPAVRITPHPDAYTVHPQRQASIETADGKWLQAPIARQTVVRNTSSSPLDYLFFQAKAPLGKWEWLAGKRFEYDFHVAHRQGPLTTSLDALLMAKVEPRDRRAGVQTFNPRRARQPRPGPTYPSDSRLDALARLDRLEAAIGGISFHLLERIVGHERWMKDVADELGAAAEYVSQRFREALWEAAQHYHGRRDSRRRGRSTGD